MGLLLLACACSNNDGDDPDAAPPDGPVIFIDARPVPDSSPTIDARPSDGPSGSDSGSVDARTFDAQIGGSPQIQTVVITHAQPCVAGAASVTTVEIVASDAETSADDLIYSGTGSCGTITGRVSTLTCPQQSPYPYVVAVRDEDGNLDTHGFTITVCTNTPDAGP